MARKSNSRPHKTSASAARQTGKREQKASQGQMMLLVACAGLCVIAVLILLFGSGGKPDSGKKSEPGILYDAVISVQDYGTITLSLDSSAAPETVKNFVELAQSGFYDGLTFHRIMDGFMIQGGDPEGNGTGGSGTNIKGEFAANGFMNPLSHVRGTISMARGAYDYNSASSQFFIVQSDSTYLDNDYAAFGYVTDGMDVVDQICAEANPIDDNGTIPREEQPVIESITVSVHNPEEDGM